LSEVRRSLAVIDEAATLFINPNQLHYHANAKLLHHQILRRVKSSQNTLPTAGCLCSID